MTDGPILELQNVTKQYPAVSEAQALAVLRGANLSVARGQSLAIVGPSGSGKSTLLNLLGALDRPTQGKVLLDGEDLSGMTDAQLARARNQRIGFIFQMHHLLPQLTVLENVLLPTLPAGGASGAVDRAKQLLQSIGLGERMSYRPGHLSGGEQQRVAVVRALINEPKLLLADEPTGSLDRASAASLADLLADLNRQQHVTLIVVTHSADLAKRMETVLELRDGKLCPMNETT